MEDLFAEIDAIDGVSVGSPYSGPRAAGQIASEGTFAGRVAYATVTLARELSQDDATVVGEEVRALIPAAVAAVDGANAGTLRIEVGGSVLAGFEPPEKTELIGLAFAVVILIVAFGSVLAMGLPVSIAVAGVGTGLGLMTLVSNLLTVPSFASLIGAMIGIGVGIDYALFIVIRYRENLAKGDSPEDATANALDTAGRAVVFAGITVVLSLLGMVIIGLAFIVGLGISAAVTVLVTMIASITLLPAFIGFAKHRVELTRYRGLVAAGLVAIALFGVGISFPDTGLGGNSAGSCRPGCGSRGGATAPRSSPSTGRATARDPRVPVEPVRATSTLEHRVWFARPLLLVASAPLLGLRLGFSDESNYGRGNHH